MEDTRREVRIQISGQSKSRGRTSGMWSQRGLRDRDGVEGEDVG